MAKAELDSAIIRPMSEKLVKKLVPISEAANFLGVSIDTIRRWDRQGIIHSERPNGKNRYFSVNELEMIKFEKPLSITEAAQFLKISVSTLRRFEKKGVISCHRKGNRRIYDKADLEKFLNSQLFLRKKNGEEKIPESSETTNRSETPTHTAEKVILEDKKQIIEKGDVASEDFGPEEVNLKSWSMIPELLAASIVFVLLLGFGLRNVKAAAKSSGVPPAVLGTIERGK